MPFADRSPVRVQIHGTSDLDAGASATLMPAAPKRKVKSQRWGLERWFSETIACVCRGPQFGCQHSCGSSRPVVTPVLGDTSSPSWPPWVLSSHGVQTLGRNTHTHETIIKNFFNDPRDKSVSMWVWAGLTTPGLTPEHPLLTVVYQTVDQGVSVSPILRWLPSHTDIW